MKIALVNDMIIAVEALRRILITIPHYEIAWIARDGAEAVKKCGENTPDLILMDLVMPVMDGVEATRQIMQKSPCAILIVTATVTGNTSKVFEAMGYGALDAVNTPILGMGKPSDGGSDLLAKISIISRLIGKNTTVKSHFTAPQKSTLPPLIALGSSTGGPKALGVILSQLSANFTGAIVIVQHIDLEFAPGLAEWLNIQTRLPVELISEGMKPEPGKILMAATNDHLVLARNLNFKYTKEPRDYPYRPSVDVFFKSLADYWPNKGIGVILTGMGRDGGEGLKALQSQKWHTIAQNQATCVVYGMPKAAVELGAAKEILPLDAIASSLIKTLATLS
jgi:two-component system response regulator WspF